MIQKFNEFSINEKKDDKWIQDAIKKEGSLRKVLGKKEGDKITVKEIDTEIAKLRKKDTNKYEKGIQGLNIEDLKLYRKLILAKTLKGIKENNETEFETELTLRDKLVSIKNSLEKLVNIIDTKELEELLFRNDNITFILDELEPNLKLITQDLPDPEIIPESEPETREIPKKHIKDIDDDY